MPVRLQPPLRIILRLLLAGVLAGCGSFAMMVLFALPHILAPTGNYPYLAEEVRLPHHIPQFQGGLSFRLVMAHDVIHERFGRYGTEHYAARNQRVAEAMDMLPPDDPRRWPLADDLAAGLDRTARSEQAVEVMRTKLQQQLQQGIVGADLYTTYANLGTFLIHANFREAMAADAEAIERFEEGVGFVRKSVEVNPAAHFGRERWQAAIAEFLLAAMKSPELLQTYDCLGNRLDLPLADILLPESAYGHPYGRYFSGELRAVDYDTPEYFAADFDAGAAEYWGQIKHLRDHITRIGAENEWQASGVTSHTEPVAFDEPMLGIIGMWRQGGGANPHFSLAIAETMLRVGQRYIAWSAYARTKLMAERYSADPAIQQYLIAHCTSRQSEIEESLPVTEGEAAGLQSQFDDELAMGQTYQHEYQAYESQKIADGIPPDDTHLWDEFHSTHPPIASPQGKEESFRYIRRSRVRQFTAPIIAGWAWFGAGCGAMLPVLLRFLIGLVPSHWKRAPASVGDETTAGSHVP